MRFLAGRIVRAALLALLLSGAAAAEEVRMAGAAFTVPDGWTLRPGTRPSVWQAERRFGPDRGVALIQVSPAIPAREGPFDAVFDRLAGSAQGLDKERPLVKGAGVTASGERIRFDLRCCARRNDVSIGAETVGISDGRRHAILMLIGLNLRGDPDKAARAGFDALVRSFRMDAAAPPAPFAPPPGAGGLSGTFTHGQTRLMPNVFGGLDFRADNEVRVFDAGGFYSDAVPPGTADVPTYCTATPTDCGTYRLLPGGTRIELRRMTGRYGLIEVSESPFGRNDDGLAIDGGTWRRLAPLPAGTRFEGTWTYLFASAGSTATGSGSVAVQRTLVLNRDGRFRRTGFAGVSSTVEGPGGRTGVTAGGNRPLEAGSYVAEGFHLVLQGDDGRRETLSLVLPEPGSDGLLVVNGGNYLRQGRK